MHYYKKSNIPILINPQGQINEEERDKLYQEAYDNTSDYHRELVKDFHDPSGSGRLPVVLQCDGTYFDTTSSSDLGKKNKLNTLDFREKI